MLVPRGSPGARCLYRDGDLGAVWQVDYRDTWLAERPGGGCPHGRGRAPVPAGLAALLAEASPTAEGSLDLVYQPDKSETKTKAARSLLISPLRAGH